MRDPISGERVLLAIGQVFGGPGYRTDPCPGIRSNIHGLLTDTSPESRRALELELDRDRRHCRP